MLLAGKGEHEVDGGLLYPTTSPLSSLGVPPAGKASCWLNLDMEMLREQFFAIRSKRRKLGEEPGRGKARTGLPPAWHWELWSAPWREGGWEMAWGLSHPILALWSPLSLLSLAGSCAPLSPGHILPAELRHRASPWQRNLGYPLAMLGLLALTVSGPGLPGELGVVPILPLPSLTPCSSQGISVLIVCFHVLELLLDDAAMPRGIQVPGWGEGTAQGCVPHRSGDQSSPTCAFSSCRMHLWARFPSPSLVPLELHCRLSSFCILQTGTCVPSNVPCVPNTVPSAIPSCFPP